MSPEARDMAPDEKDLVQRARVGDEEAFAMLVRRYQGPIFRLCGRYLSIGDAEDAAQETFVRAFVHRGTLDPERPLLPWLATVARHLCLDRLRKMKPDLKETIEVDSQAATAESTAAAREDLRLIARGLAELKPNQREALMLFHLEGMSYANIAVTLDVPIGTVMTLLFRGREQLRQMLARAHTPRAVGTDKEARS
jgi:RNA polymerase sigma-70 factor, ECF subfamily